MPDKVPKWLLALGGVGAVMAVTLVMSFALLSLAEDGTAEAGSFCQTFYEGVVPVVEPRQGPAAQAGPDSPIFALLPRSSEKVQRGLFASLAEPAPPGIRSSVILLSSGPKFGDGLESGSNSPVSSASEKGRLAALEKVDRYLGRNCPLDSPLAMQVMLDHRSTP
ncbi:MAG TPA: hypothetical protein VFU11_08700 [Solirubrobacterales bacterium]|nr:hypothetical protein [Solirubrobacterales bacterium]